MNKYIKIGRLEFLADCAKGMSLSKFKDQFQKIEKFGLDVEKSFIILGGKIESKKVFKKQKD